MLDKSGKIIPALILYQFLQCIHIRNSVIILGIHVITPASVANLTLCMNYNSPGIKTLYPKKLHGMY